MPARDVLKNYHLIVDGRGYAGQVEEYSPPDLALVIEEHRAGGMDTATPIDMGMEPLESSFTLAAYDRNVLALFGVREGNTVPLTVHGGLESEDGTVTKVLHAMRGKITKVARGTWKAGEKATMQITLRLTYYREEHGGQPLHEIDVENYVRRIDGVDQLAELRTALAL